QQMPNAAPTPPATAQPMPPVPNTMNPPAGSMNPPTGVPSGTPGPINPPASPPAKKIPTSMREHPEQILNMNDSALSGSQQTFQQEQRSIAMPQDNSDIPESEILND